MIDVHVEGVLTQHLGEEETGERQLDQHVLVQRLEQLKNVLFCFKFKMKYFVVVLLLIWSLDKWCGFYMMVRILKALSFLKRKLPSFLKETIFKI